MMQAQESLIRVELVPGRLEYPEEVWEVNLDHISLSTEEVMEELAKIPWAEGGRYPANYSLSGRHGQTSWGASGSYGEFILQLGVAMGGGVGTVAVQAAIKSAFAKIRSHAEGESLDSLNDEQGAMSVARSRVSSIYDVDSAALSVKRSEIDASSSSYEFEFAHADGRSFGAEIKQINGVKACIRIWMNNYQPQIRREYQTPTTDNS